VVTGLPLTDALHATSFPDCMFCGNWPGSKLSEIAAGSTHDQVGLGRCKSYRSYLERATGQDFKAGSTGKKPVAPSEPGCIEAWALLRV
jgi:hypothetical protein